MWYRVRELWSYRGLIGCLARAQLLVKYRGSFFGVLWSLLHPLALIVVYTIAFEWILRIQLDDYAAFLLVGLLPWIFFATSLVAATGSILGNARLLHHARIPREVLPLASVVFLGVQLVLALSVLTPFLVFAGSGRPWSLMLYPLALVLFVLFTVGLCVALSGLAVSYRDVPHLAEVGPILLFWVTPVVYPLERVPTQWRTLFELNPLALFMSCFHDLGYWHRLPDASTWLALIAWAGVSLSFGFVVFRRIEPRLAEEL